MDYHPFSRSLPDLVGDFPSHPTTSFTPSSPYISVSRNFTPPLCTQKEEVYTREEQPIAREHKSTYDKALSWIGGFKAWEKGRPTAFSLEDYEKPKVIKMSAYDSAKLEDELNFSENDDA